MHPDRQVSAIVKRIYYNEQARVGGEHGGARGFHRRLVTKFHWAREVETRVLGT